MANLPVWRNFRPVEYGTQTCVRIRLQFRAQSPLLQLLGGGDSNSSGSGFLDAGQAVPSWLDRMLMLSGDVETNPGPRDFPCGKQQCGKNVGWGLAPQCSICTKWFHASCSGLSRTEIKRLPTNHTWQCANCKNSRTQISIQNPNPTASVQQITAKGRQNPSTVKKTGEETNFSTTTECRKHMD